MTSEPIVKVEDVSFAYNGQMVLENINFTVHSKDFTGIIGPNGGGKTTLLKLILGLLSPFNGKISVMGNSPEKHSFLMGYVPQYINFNIDFPITALDVVLMGKLNDKNRWARYTANDRDDALFALEKLNMAAHAQKKIGELSGGQRQRVLIARALITQPKLLLLDEPTASIDTSGQARFFELLQKLNKDVAILVVSHDLFAISSYIKSVACVNKGLHYHPPEEISGDMLETMYSCSVEDTCQVQAMARGIHQKNYIPRMEEISGDS